MVHLSSLSPNTNEDSSFSMSAMSALPYAFLLVSAKATPPRTAPLNPAFSSEAPKS